MKLLIQILVALMGIVMASAQMRGSFSSPVADPSQLARERGASTSNDQKTRNLKSMSMSGHGVAPTPPTPVPTLPPANFFVSGTYGERRRCFDKRFTMVCSWEAEKKTKKYYKSNRRLRKDDQDMDYEDEDEEAEYREVHTPDGRRLKVELDNVECILGVGKKDSADSDDEYEEYKERVPFPDDRWTIKIGEQVDSGPIAPFFVNYSFDTRITFEDIEDPNNSGDEITISGQIFIRMACGPDPVTREEKLFFRSHDVRITC